MSSTELFTTFSGIFSENFNPLKINLDILESPLKLFCVIVLLFTIYSFIGWCWESFIVNPFEEKKFVNRGFLNGPYCPIYGFGAFFLLILNVFTDRPVEQFFLGAIICCTLEYATSVAMEKIFSARWWDYKKYPFNINGRVCLYSFIVFGLCSIISGYIQSAFATMINGMNEVALYIIGFTLFAIVLVDTIITTRALHKFQKTLKKYQQLLEGKIPGVFNFIRRGRNAIELHITGKKQGTFFTRQQRRILKAFPRFESTKYKKAFHELKKKQIKLGKKLAKTKFVPEPTTKKKSR